MDLTYLLDTNILSAAMREPRNKRLVRKLSQHSELCATASIVWHELLFGCFTLPQSDRRTRIERHLFETYAPNLPILPYDEDAAHLHAEYRARWSSRGQSVPIADGQIGAIALVNGLTLVTANVSDFSMFDGLKIENWLE